MIFILSGTLGGALVAASFVGLCAGLRVKFGLDRLIAPACGVCLVMGILMLAGMVGLLRLGVIALYALGLGGLLYAYALRKSKPSPALLALFGAFLAYLLWRFHGCQILQHDDFSQWALVARHLLTHDRFPGAADVIVTNQSYPLGTACFIYFFARPIANEEWLWLVAQYFLTGIALLPLFSVIQTHPGALCSLLGALCVLFFGYACSTASLKPDDLLAFLGASMIAMIVHYRRDPRRALLSALPVMIAITWVKSSGLFFPPVAAILLIYFSRRDGWYTRRHAWMLLAVPIVSYLIWTLFIKLRFPAALNTTHAVSLLNYAKNLHRKGFGGVLEITKRIIEQFFRLNVRREVALAAVLFLSIPLAISLCALSPQRRRAYLGACAAALGAYLLWYVMLYLMYLFSMPKDEALNLAAIGRYDATGYTYAALLVAIVALLSMQEAKLAKGIQGGVAAIAITAMLALAFIPNKLTELPALYDAQHISNQYKIVNAGLRDMYSRLRQTHSLSSDKKYILYYQEDYVVSDIYVLSKYELETSNIYLIHNSKEAPNEYIAGLRWGVFPVDRLQTALDESIEQADALIMVDESPEFEGELNRYLEAHETELHIYRNLPVPTEPAVDRGL